MVSDETTDLQRQLNEVHSRLLDTLQRGRVQQRELQDEISEYEMRMGDEARRRVFLRLVSLLVLMTASMLWIVLPGQVMTRLIGCLFLVGSCWWVCDRMEQASRDRRIDAGAGRRMGIGRPSASRGVQDGPITRRVVRLEIGAAIIEPVGSEELRVLFPGAVERLRVNQADPAGGLVEAVARSIAPVGQGTPEQERAQRCAGVEWMGSLPIATSDHGV